MQKARKKGYTMFSLQFYGECWSGPNAEIKYNKDGSADTCIMDLAPPYDCDKASSHECVGAQSTNYVYRIDESRKYFFHFQNIVQISSLIQYKYIIMNMSYIDKYRYKWYGFPTVFFGKG